LVHSLFTNGDVIATFRYRFAQLRSVYELWGVSQKFIVYGIGCRYVMWLSPPDKHIKYEEVADERTDKSGVYLGYWAIELAIVLSDADWNL